MLLYKFHFERSREFANLRERCKGTQISYDLLGFTQMLLLYQCRNMIYIVKYGVQNV